MTSRESDLLAAVERSPDAAGRRDRAGWVGLFTADGAVEDPVGSRPHIGHDQIRRFYDTFIGPRQVTFDRDADIVDGSTVIRDLTLRIQMSDRVAMAVPAILRYTVRDDAGDLKIAGLQAYWELPPMMLQFARNGVAAVPAGIALARALLTNQGLRGTLGFLRGMRRPGRRHRAVVVDALTALSVGDDLAIRRALGAAELSIDLGELSRRLRGASWGKQLGAGRSIATTVHTTDGRAVVIADFGDRVAIRRLHLFG